MSETRATKDRVPCLLAELRRKWQAGERPSVERLLAGYPEIAADRKALFDVVYGEFCLRQELGQCPNTTEYQQRFPQLADDLSISLNSLKIDCALRAPITETDAPHSTPAETDATAIYVSAPTNAQNAHPEDRATGSRYRVVRPHAKGGLGEVFVAFDEELNREVALKEIQARHADHASSRGRFLLEAEVTGRLEHPGIVPVYGLGKYADGRPYYAMRFIRGESLDEAIKHFRAEKLSASERSLQLRKLLGRFIEVCNAIDYAHSRGVLHRDIKPANIMLGKYGETLVVDWGLAKTFDRAEPVAPNLESVVHPASGDSAPTQMGTTLGTPQYMSPEQAAGQIDRLGPATDIYSLGATLYALLAGRAPIDRGDLSEVLDRVREGRFDRPRELDRTITKGLEAIVVKAMALNPLARYASARALADDLEHWLADEPIAARRDHLAASLGRWSRKHRAVVTALAALLMTATLASVLGLIAISAEQRQTLMQRERADLQKARADQVGYTTRIHAAETAWEAKDITGAWEHLVACPPELRGWEFGYLYAKYTRGQRTINTGVPILAIALAPNDQRIATLDQQGVITIRNIESGDEVTRFGKKERDLNAIAFSPDGKWIAGTGFTKYVKIWNAETGEEASKFGHQSDFFCIAFSSNGKRIACGADDKTIRVWDTETGACVHTPSGHDGKIWSVAFDPDCNQIVSGSDDHTVRLWSAATGKEQHILKGHTAPVLCVAFSPDGTRIGSASVDKTIRIWDTKTCNELRVLSGHEGIVWGLSFSPDGNQIASASSDKTVKVWDLASGDEAMSLRGHAATIGSIVFNRDGKCIITGCDDGTMKIWNSTAEAYENPKSIPEPAYLGELARSADGKWLVVGRQQMSKLTNGLSFRDRVRRYVQENDGKVNDGEPTLRVLDVETGVERSILQGNYRGRGSQVAVFNRDGSRLAMWCEDAIRIWDCSSGAEMISIGKVDSAKCLVFSRDGTRIAAAFLSEEQREVFPAIAIWSVETGAQTLFLENGYYSVTTLAFSPDETFLAMGLKEGDIKLWNLATKNEFLSLKGHVASVNSVAFSPDGSRIVSASDDTTLKIWDSAFGHEIVTLRAHTDPVDNVAFSFDGIDILSRSGIDDDRIVKVWAGAATDDKFNRSFVPRDLMESRKDRLLQIRDWTEWKSRRWLRQQMRSTHYR